MKILFCDDAFPDEEQSLNNDKYHLDTSFPKKKNDFENDSVILRNWMMSHSEYSSLDTYTQRNNGSLLISYSDYKKANYINGWYPCFKDVTFRTEIFSLSDCINENWKNIDTFINQSQWNGFFVKDFAKSLTTSRGSIAKDLKEVNEVIKEMQFYGIDKGIAIRELHDLNVNTEKRHFCFQGNIISNSPIESYILEKVEQFEHPFFSFDTIQDNNGKQWIVEIGDGQVSSLKNISVEMLYQNIFNNKNVKGMKI
jgi:uncharacterized protein YozE (UPF0346 family)